jgi:hypothetical protein
LLNKSGHKSKFDSILLTAYILTNTLNFIRIRIFYCQFWAHKGQTRIHIQIEIPN